MRFVGKSRLGLYPLPLSEAQRVRRFLLFPDQPSSALDPCVGDGVAFEAITSDAEVLRYGIELDAYRAEQARQRIPDIVQGNTLEVQCAVECFGLLYLNPPYDWALGPADSRRTEQSFLSHTYRWLKPGGVLLFVIPRRPGADPQSRRTILCDNDPTFVLYRISQRFGLPVVPERAAWFNEELNRRGAIKPLIGLGCSPVLVSGTKKLFLKWIRRALRQKRIEVPSCNGPVQWSLSNSFFRVGKDDLGEGTLQELGEDSPATLTEEDTQSCESS